MALLTPQRFAEVRAGIVQQRQARRGMIPADEMLKRARSAARLVLRGNTFSADDREECAARILTDALAQTRRQGCADCTDGASCELNHGGALIVRESDPLHSFTAYKHRAEHFRRDLLKRRDAEQAALDSDADSRASAPMQGERLIRGDVETPEQAREIVADVMHRLALDNDNARTFLYWQVRDVDQQQIADEEGATVGAVKMRCKRGALALTRAYPTTTALLDALIEPGCQWCLEDDEVLIRFARIGLLPHGVRQLDDSKVHRGMMTPDWRTGTAAGDRPEPLIGTREERAEQARKACRKGKASHWGVSSYRRTAKTLTEQEQADALGRLGAALHANDPHRKPRKPKARKVTPRDASGSADPAALAGLTIAVGIAGVWAHQLLHLI